MASQSVELGGVHEPSPELDQLLQLDVVVCGRKHELLDAADNGLGARWHGIVFGRALPLYHAHQSLLNVSPSRDSRARHRNEQQHRHVAAESEAALVRFLKSILDTVVFDLTGLAIIELGRTSRVPVRGRHRFERLRQRPGGHVVSSNVLTQPSAEQRARLELRSP
jgi:hypothetical protein